MNKGFYLKMAWGNIRKNRNIYLPYLLAASVMTALFYIQGSLCDMVDISGMKGKRMMSSLLGISTPITDSRSAVRCWTGGRRGCCGHFQYNLSELP